MQPSENQPIGTSSASTCAELNSEERLNSDLKQVIRGKVQARTKVKLRAATENHLRDIARKLQPVKTHFEDVFVKPAARSTWLPAQ